MTLNKKTTARCSDLVEVARRSQRITKKRLVELLGFQLSAAYYKNKLNSLREYSP